MAGKDPALSVFFVLYGTGIFLIAVTRAEEVSETTNIDTNSNDWYLLCAKESCTGYGKRQVCGNICSFGIFCLKQYKNNKERRLCTRVTQWNLPDVPLR